VLLALVAITRPELILLPGLSCWRRCCSRRERARPAVDRLDAPALVAAAIPLIVNDGPARRQRDRLPLQDDADLRAFLPGRLHPHGGGTILDVLVKGFGLAAIDGRWWYVLPLTQLLAVFGGIGWLRRGQRFYAAGR
jgi:hypothetical protein